MKKIIFIIALVGGTFFNIHAQETSSDLVLSLDEAITYAIDFNKSLKNSRLDVERSKRRIWESISQGLPQVDGTFDYINYFNYEMSFDLDMGDDFDFTQDQITQAMDQTLATFPGVTQTDIYNHTAGSYFDYTLSAMQPPSTILMSDQSTAKLQVSQLIFSGQYIVGIQTAKLAQKIAEQNFDFNELDIKEAVINAYYLVLITDETLKIIEQNLENLNGTLESTRNMYAAGMAEETDVDQLSITVNQLANTKNAMQRNLELNYNLLRFQLGLETTVGITLTDNLEGLYAQLNPDEIFQNPFEIESNVTFQIMKTQTEINEKMLELEKWNYAPTIGGFYNYNAKIQTTGFDMTPNHLAGISLSLPIFSSGMRKAKVDQAKIDYQKAQTSKSILEDQLRLQDKQFRYNLLSSIENYETQRDNVEVAKRVFDSFTRKYEQGMASSLELTQANTNYLDAESNFITAIMDVLNAKIQLDKLMNNF